MTTQCAWCDRYDLGDGWVDPRDAPGLSGSGTTHGICPDCVAELRSAGKSV